MARNGASGGRRAANGAGPVSAAGDALEQASASVQGVECMDCASLPDRPDDAPCGGPLFQIGQGYRPGKPRPIDARSTPRRPRCTTHWRAASKAQKAVQAAKRSRKRSGLDEDTRVALWAIQGRRCPCGAQPSRGVPDADHDHELAREHDHAEDVACSDCMRGFLCRACNREILGRRSLAQLRALVAYLEDPPMRRLERAMESVSHAGDTTADGVDESTVRDVEYSA